MAILIEFVFYLSALVLASICVITANSMSKETCRCMKNCLCLVIVGLVGLIMAVYYELQHPWKVLCVIPIIWGVAGWIFFDRYRAHQDILMIKVFIKDIADWIKSHIKHLVEQL